MNENIHSGTWQRQKRLNATTVSVGHTIELNDNHSIKTKAIGHIQSIITEQLRQAKKEADDIREAAQQEAQDIINAAQEEAQKRLTDVELDSRRQQAYEEGYHLGREAIIRECHTQLSLANSLLEQAQDAHDALMKASHEAQFALAKQLAEVILHDTLSTQPSYMAQLLSAAQSDLMGQMTSKAGVIHIHPESLAGLQQLSPESTQALSHLEFRCDPKYPKDRIYLDTSETSWDISPKTQLESWVQALKAQIITASEKGLENDVADEDE